jgi:hypothetical protein
MKKSVKKKKKIDIASETEGTAVAPVGIKEKKLDLTDEIRLFLACETTHQSIMKILLRTQSSYLGRNYEKNRMKITKVSKSGYFITIASKSYEFKFFMDYYNLIEIGFFERQKMFLTSRLKSDMNHKIFEWIEKQNLSFDMDEWL